MTPPREGGPGRTTEEAVRAVHRAMSEAMVDADAAALGDLLTDDFTLTHMTGYRQSRAAWLDQVDSGEMTYHRMQDVEVHIDVSDTEHPVLTARTRTDATIWGGRGQWPLQLMSTFERAGDDWIIARTVASTW